MVPHYHWAQPWRPLNIAEHLDILVVWWILIMNTQREQGEGESYVTFIILSWGSWVISALITAYSAPTRETQIQSLDGRNVNITLS